MINSPKSIINSLHGEPKSTYRGFTSSTALPTSLKFRRTNNKQAFTIVELLVVIVVIAILAAITIVSYTGISNKAVVSSLQSDLDNASRQLKLYYTDNGYYPTSVPETSLGSRVYCPDPPDTRYCLKATSGNTLNYIPLPPINSFKLTANNTNSSTKYYITDNTSPSSTNNLLNLMITGDNASFEDGTKGSWLYGSGGATVANSYPTHGIYCIKFSLPASPGDSPRLGVTSITSPGVQYTASAYITPLTTNGSRISLYDNVAGSVTGNTIPMGTTGRSIVTKTFGVGSTSRSIYITHSGTTWPSEVYADAIQLELGSTATPF